MNLDLPTLFGASAGAITTISSLWIGWRHIRYSLQAKKDRERQKILDEANEGMAKVEAKLNEKIRHLQNEIEDHKQNITKDLGHLKELQENQVKVLADKIEILREELRDGHANMIALLTKLVSKS